MTTEHDRTVLRGYVQTHAGQIHYRTAGEGPPLLLLHPNGMSSALFNEVIPQLAQKFRVIAPDRLGHGQSDSLPADFPRYMEGDLNSYPAGRIEPYLVEVDLALLDALNVDNVYILGQHTGSHLAIEMAIAAPDRVAGLVLVSVTDWQTRDDPLPHYTVPPRWANHTTSPFLDVDRLTAARESRVHYRTMAQRKPDGSHLTDLWRMREEMQASESTDADVMHAITIMAIECIASWEDTSPQVTLYYFANRRLPMVSVPVALVAGEQDEPGMFLEQQRDLVPSGKLVGLTSVPNVGAYFALEDPSKFASVVASYLEKM